MILIIKKLFAYLWTVIFISICIFATLFLLNLYCWRFGERWQSNQNHYKKYVSFQKEWKILAAYLPESSTDIQHYYVLEFDTNYHYLEATAKLSTLEEFINSHKYFDYPFHHSDVSYSETSFAKLFFKKPDWWNQESLADYKENCLIIGLDHNDYGEGLWFFYTKEKEKIRVFVWSQQWLPAEKVKKGLIQN
ncbi:MAG: hypothetical protein FJ263_04980 [Planctomycetes bacterium]|nr:hypothetical protein [Planctomycetota bacterium]